MKTILFSVSYLIEVEEDLLLGTQEAEAFNDNVFDKLSKNRWKKIDESHIAQWNSSSFLELNPMTINCGKCFRCDTWVTDREKTDGIIGLTNGAVEAFR